MVRTLVFAALLSLAFAACSRKPAEEGPERHYQLSGTIVSLDARHRTAMVDAATVPNFMEAMTMEYPVSSPAEFKALHVGDKIKATLNVRGSGDDYSLSNIQKQNASQRK